MNSFFLKSQCNLETAKCSAKEQQNKQTDIQTNKLETTCQARNPSPMLHYLGNLGKISNLFVPCFLICKMRILIETGPHVNIG